MMNRLKTMKRQLSRYAPLGFDTGSLSKVMFIITLTLAFIIFLVSYRRDWSMARTNPSQIDEIMQPFVHYIKWYFYFFGLCLARAIYLAVKFYRYHIGDGNSIYVMKRLPDENEFTRRYLGLPVIIAATDAAGYIITIIISFIIYTVGGALIC